MAEITLDTKSGEVYKDSGSDFLRTSVGGLSTGPELAEQSLRVSDF